MVVGSSINLLLLLNYIIIIINITALSIPILKVTVPSQSRVSGQPDIPRMYSPSD